MEVRRPPANVPAHNQAYTRRRREKAFHQPQKQKSGERGLAPRPRPAPPTPSLLPPSPPTLCHLSEHRPGACMPEEYP